MFSTTEYRSPLTNVFTDYSDIQKYNKSSQFGPTLPPSTPSMQFPTLLEQGNRFGYDALTHDGDGSNYYSLESAYGKSCNPKFYVAKCPENKFLRPFVPDRKDYQSPSNCPIKTQSIAEGFTPAPVDEIISFLKTHQVHFFYDSTGKCPYSNMAIEKYLTQLKRPLTEVFILKDVRLPENKKLLTDLGGTATPFFYDKKNNHSVTGYVPEVYHLYQLLKQPTKEYYSDPVQDLQIVVYTLSNCVFCEKLKAMLKQQGVLDKVTILDARQHMHELNGVKGFPYIISKKTGKSVTGFDPNFQLILNKLR